MEFPRGWVDPSRAPADADQRSPFIWRTVVFSILILPFAVVLFAQVPAPGDFVINEVLADPASDLSGDANGDGNRDASEDEFVEIVNVSAFDLDISGLTLGDGAIVQHVFPAGTIVPPLCTVVVFGGGLPTGEFGGALVQTATTGGLGLSNGGDVISLFNGAVEIVSFVYGPPPCDGDNDQSLTLEPELTGVCTQHTAAAGSGGSLFSPGTQVDTTPFGDCGRIFADGFESGGTSAWN